MDKTMQEQEEMQDKELYALLEQALTQERLCVSEELIQKTLKRIEEQGTTERMPERKSKMTAWMRYASVAAAAMLVVALGIGMRGGMGMNHATNEAMPEMWAGRTEESLLFDKDTEERSGEKKANESRNVSATASETVTQYSVADEALDATEPQAEGIVFLEGTVVSLPKLWENGGTGSNALQKDAGEAEYWEFVDTEADWKTELVQRMSEREPEDYLPLGTGDYEYALECSDGSRQIVGFREPLERIVRIPTEYGVIWCLFGEELYLYLED